jgi:predicted dienelactone hydrolase
MQSVISGTGNMQNNFEPYRIGRFFGFAWFFYVCFWAIQGVSGAYTVSSTAFVWHDVSRNRTIPVKIYYPAAHNGENFPVIVFSHGLGGSIDCCSYLATAWASRGFVAVFLQHPGSDENVWKGKILILNELRESYRYNWNGRTRALDIRFVLDHLEQLAAKNHWLAGKLDLNQIGVGGYDLGALASLLVTGQVPPDQGGSLYDSRIRAVLAMSPPVNSSGRNYREVYDPIEVPAFFITGTEDDGIVGTTKAYQRRIPFDSMSRNNRYLIVFQGGDHRIYSEHTLSLLARNDQRFQTAIIKVSGCFWQAVLQKNPKAEMTLNSYGLKSLLGGMATVEQRIHNTEVSAPPASSEEPVNSTEDFPVSRFYRRIVEKYADDPVDKL